MHRLVQSLGITGLSRTLVPVMAGNLDRLVQDSVDGRWTPNLTRSRPRTR